MSEIKAIKQELNEISKALQRLKLKMEKAEEQTKSKSRAHQQSDSDGDSDAEKPKKKAEKPKKEKKVEEKAEKEPHKEIMEIDNTTAGLWEDGKKFIIRKNSERDWCLTIYNDNSMFLLMNKPYTHVYRFKEKPYVITYEDNGNWIMITRRDNLEGAPDLAFKLENKKQYEAFKSLKLEEIYCE